MSDAPNENVDLMRDGFRRRMQDLDLIDDCYRRMMQLAEQAASMSPNFAVELMRRHASMLGTLRAYCRREAEHVEVISRYSELVARVAAEAAESPGAAGSGAADANAATGATLAADGPPAALADKMPIQTPRPGELLN